MHLSRDSLCSLLEYHYSRRDALFEFSHGLSSDDLLRPLPTPSGTYLGILRHVLATEEFWLRGAMAGEPTLSLSESEGLSDLQGKAKLVMGRTYDQLGSLGEADLATVLERRRPDGVAFAASRSEIFAHIITHDAYHRGQCLLVAQLMGHEVPDLDLLR